MLGTVAYGAWYWLSTNKEAGGSSAHAERTCRDAINGRFDLARLNVFEVSETSNGYTVRASGTLRNGTSARLVCLTSPNGSVRDVTIQHH